MKTGKNRSEKQRIFRVRTAGAKRGDQILPAHSYLKKACWRLIITAIKQGMNEKPTFLPKKERKTAGAIMF
ncbi:hypothetical protein NLX67_20135 [Domibacillus sp. A3M-37]|uniref:hypothetical protein n=1 Tax=Domibacillus sp. A3M-37 TaxID=2962037 RepID=UPI0020B7AF06|nr:hypothetical protein [Domibacillus sp. A3M-37]MCP3764653.1 hypothetical protein [Domibacillus sp. A3M-37]